MIINLISDRSKARYHSHQTYWGQKKDSQHQRWQVCEGISALILYTLLGGLTIYTRQYGHFGRQFLSIYKSKIHKPYDPANPLHIHLLLLLPPCENIHKCTQKANSLILITAL